MIGRHRCVVPAPGIIALLGATVLALATLVCEPCGSVCAAAGAHKEAGKRAAADRADGSDSEKPDSSKPWKVDDPHGPGRTISFSTDEGTWISLDVHPDGRRIVFSLLGDLYVLPAEGGTARRITSGPAYDVQPRFSPDGKWIAFTSDRGGMDNLWICDLDGQNARAVSAEKDSDVSQPAWSPDGDWLLARKRITDTSSIGVVELWMWHIKGGQGIRITKGEEQPDAADAVFSRDGRFVYYSARDSRYRYDRNVNEGIWQIKRFDRRTGQSVPVTGEFGGAGAPALSPDGATMAFVRRVRAKTRLELMDLGTGKVRTLADDVQRDEQEGFCTHGVFPGYSWTPDGRAVVATAGGRFWRYDASTGARDPIPFTADVEQRVADAIRIRQHLGEDALRARIIRWPVESPDGRTLVFSAAGHLYIAGLPPAAPATPEGETVAIGGATKTVPQLPRTLHSPPRRLTTVSDLEYAPAFSPDGSRLAFVTWNDTEGGHVWTVPVEGGAAGAPLRLTQVPGQYANPAFSPDGKRIVFVKGSGASFRDEDLADELWHEIHWIDAGGGPSHYVIGTKNRGSNRRTARPAFSSDGERIFYVEDEEPQKPSQPPKTVLVSVKLDGTDRTAHLRWSKAEEASVSPDGRWVVFNELHNAYVTALPRAGNQTVDLSLDGAALPLGTLTDEGGEWVGWADGGRTITWIFGPVYHRLALDAAFPPPTKEDGGGAEKKRAGNMDGDADDPASVGAAVDAPSLTLAAAPAVRSGRIDGGKDGDSGDHGKENKDKKPGLPKSDAIEIVLTLPRAKPEGTTVYRGARIVTMKGDEVIERGMIIVEKDRIKAVGPEGSVAVPPGAKVVDLSARTVIPGLIDEHAHLHYSTLDIFPQRPWKYLANLAYGITTTHDPSAATHEVFGQSEMVEAGLMTGPRIFSTGFILYGADIPGKAVVKSLDDARHHIRRLKSLGAFTVKSYMQPRRDQRQWIIQAAREEGVMVVPEGAGDLEADMTMILDGHTTVEHALPIAPLYKDVVTLFSRSRTSYTPTLLVAYGGITGDRWFYQHDEVWKNERLLSYTPQGVIDRSSRIRSIMATDEDWHHIDVAASALKVLRAGGRVCLGGHGQMQGLGPHWELRAFVQGGMTPMEALRVATLFPAETLGLDADLGSIEPGKLADFVVLEKNPLENIENSASVTLVVKSGFAWTPKELERRH